MSFYNPVKQLNDNELMAAGVISELLRISAGIDNIEKYHF